MQILIVNTGSASVKLDLVEIAPDGIHSCCQGRYSPDAGTPEALLTRFLDENDIEAVDGISHRVVHGGSEFMDSCIVNEATEAAIERLGAVAPLHNPRAYAWIRACRRLGRPQVAAFDTAFYAQLPSAAAHYALPYDAMQRHGVRRYGFHGIAHRAMWQRWCELRPDLPEGGRLISLQLGGGCSITATANGAALDTSMGFSPLEGLMMATRSGDVDPGVVIYWMREAGISPDDMDAVLNQDSGLLGVSGRSANVDELLDQDDPRCRLALEMYTYRARKYVGAYLAVLGGADGVVFGGGVGEHVPWIREGILQPMQWCGITFDAAANARATGGEAALHANDSATEIWVLPVDEAAVLAREAYRLLTHA